MFKKILYWLIIIFLYCCVTETVCAENKFGIHILEPVEIKEAAELVNSSGGDWGYATIVLRDDDFDKQKWQKFMNDCRRLHIIPIIRIATHIENNYWAKPEKEDLEKYVDFLHSLNWPVKKQWVILFNEPNHNNEWGGEIKPSEYVEISYKLGQLLKSKNSNFSVMLAGLDQAADGRNGTMKAEEFIKKMLSAKPEILGIIDGWCSHSYPNNGFIGKPDDVGKGTIKGYKWELGIVSQVLQKTPQWKVYITETGWPYGRGYYIEETASEYIIEAFEFWEEDPQVKAVTPFVLNAPEGSFKSFSWLKKNGQKGEAFQKVLGVSKNKNLPEQIEKYLVKEVDFPEIVPTGKIIEGKAVIENKGQSILGERQELDIDVKIYQGSTCFQPRRLETGPTSVEPGENMAVSFSFQTGSRSAEYKLQIEGENYPFYVFKPFELKNDKISVWEQLKSFVKFRILK